MQNFDENVPMIARPQSDPNYSRLQSHYWVHECHLGSPPLGYRGVQDVQDVQELLATLSFRCDLHRVHLELCSDLWRDWRAYCSASIVAILW